MNNIIKLVILLSAGLISVYCLSSFSGFIFNDPIVKRADEVSPARDGNDNSNNGTSSSLITSSSLGVDISSWSVMSSSSASFSWSNPESTTDLRQPSSSLNSDSPSSDSPSSDSPSSDSPSSDSPSSGPTSIASSSESTSQQSRLEAASSDFGGETSQTDGEGESSSQRSQTSDVGLSSTDEGSLDTSQGLSSSVGASTSDGASSSVTLGQTVSANSNEGVIQTFHSEKNGKTVVVTKTSMIQASSTPTSSSTNKNTEAGGLSQTNKIVVGVVVGVGGAILFAIAAFVFYMKKHNNQVENKSWTFWRKNEKGGNDDFLSGELGVRDRNINQGSNF